jgi:FkbM family methyltransferase
MKLTTRIIHQLVRASKTDSILAAAGMHFSVLNKLIPLSIEYPAEENRIVSRDGVLYQLDISDYAQWSVFANQPEYSWKCVENELSQAKIILDIGANVGQFCLKIAHLLNSRKIFNFQVHAFEPSPFIFGALSNNLSLNEGLRQNVHLHQLALGDAIGETYFSYSITNSGSGRVSTDQTGSQIEITTLDNWFKKERLSRVDFIKIDVEGLEPQVLLGGQEVITKFKPDLYLEITDEWFKNRGYSSEWMFDLLRSWGYDWWVNRNGKLEAKTNSSEAKKPQFNILARSK